MTHKQQNVLVMLLSSLVLGVGTDILVRQEIFGLNFVLWSFVWVTIIGAGAYIKKIATPLLCVQLLFVVFNALMVYIRSETIVQLWSVTLALTFLGLCFGRVYIDGYEKLSLFAKFIEWLSAGVTSLGSILVDIRKSHATEPAKKTTHRATVGIAVAIPLALVFIGLFASSDEIFRNSFSWIGDLFTAIADFLAKFDIARLLAVLFWSLIALSWIGIVVYKRRNPVVIDQALPRVMKAKDISIILGSVVIVFAFYILIQLRYLFGGSSLPDGLTYATYARRGYGELLLVTLLASAVIYVTKTVAKEVRNRATSVLSISLLLLNGLVILSAWKRLSLYEDAYGWTMTRFVARMGLICIFLGSVSLFLWLRGYINTPRLYRMNWYIVAFVLMVSAIFNPVGLVTERNLIDRPEREVSLDLVHMLSQSPDSYGAICSNAQILRIDHPDEYMALKTRSIEDPSNRYYGNYGYDTNSNKGMSRHYVYSDAFKSKYHNCLP
jgi:hypothetical protein